MSQHPGAGQPAPVSSLTNIARLVSAYYTESPDPANPAQRVSFGTSGHRGSALKGGFNEAHVLAISQAVCEYRVAEGIEGPLFVGMDTHALSEPGFASVLEVLAANGVTAMIDEGRGYTPTPVLSFAILSWNHAHGGQRADGIIITPSHNPPDNGGIKYNPPHGGPAGAEVTGWIEKRANELLREGNREIRRVVFQQALRAGTTRRYDYTRPYVEALGEVVDMQAIAAAGIRMGVDPLGGAAVHYWPRVAEHYGLHIEVVNERVDPAFAFMPLDHDGKIRMDCSSPFAMAGLIALKDRFDVAFGNDPDSDRHGIVTPAGGLMNPNHYLCAAIDYLFQRRRDWPAGARVGKTLVSSSMIDRVATRLKREVYEVPVGFKWFVDVLLQGACAFGGEESAGASFLRRDGRVWTTEKDGLILGLLAAEMLAVSDKDPAECYRELTRELGEPVYERLDAPASAEQKALLKKLGAEQVSADTLAGDPVVAKLTRAPGNQAPIGGLKVITAHGWFAARPSGTEDIYKIYTESFRGRDHLDRIQQEARQMVDAVFAAAGVS